MFASAIDMRRTRTVGPQGSRFRACRITHSITHDQAALQIRAGGRPGSEPDAPVQFVLDAQALDEFIAELSVIREQLAPTPQARARVCGGDFNG